MTKQLPVYNLTIDSTDLESGVFAVALVNEPAIELDWLAFKAASEKKFEFKTINADKQLLAGFLMIPDKLIYRNENGNEYYVTFSAPTIEQISEKFNKNQFQNQFNKEHNSDQPLNNVFVKENWIIESDVNDKSVLYGFTPIVGSWFAVIRVNNTTIWNEYIKTGQLNGFSVEGAFMMNYTETVPAEFRKEITPIQAYLKNLVNP